MADNPKVLVVEDMESWRRLYEGALKEAGYLPFITSDLDTALQLMTRHFFHAALLDVVLVDRDQNQEQGMQVLEKLLEIGEHTGVVMVTGYSTDERMDRAYSKYRVTRFLRKRTYDAAELLQEMAKASTQSTAYLESRRSDDLRPPNLVRQSNLRDLEMQLLGRASGRLVDLLQSLLHPCVPLLVCEKFEQIDTSGASPVFETHYWSRMMGEEILVRIGPRKQILYEVNELKQAGQHVFFATRQDVSGLRYVLPGESPSKFSDCTE